MQTPLHSSIYQLTTIYNITTIKFVSRLFFTSKPIHDWSK